ncbi:hypothetical protein QC761_0098090 [Podospora bellae-mahoneyi]|uniref:Uncharacterized protein n=1 Tax=Podospora bellae-mahoneyi TaxID=2093777 RepID=A0ABR0FCB8_9PEZI|nr:hypothetical protein QC761_0098090 [Podospora bellae-mahoneyi]
MSNGTYPSSPATLPLTPSPSTEQSRTRLMKWNTSISARTKPSKTTYEPLLKPTPLKTRKTRRGGTATSRVSDAKHGPQKKGITYLRGVEGTPKNGPGPNECGRVSCGYGAAIHGCNENGFEKEVTWNGIADGAEDLKGLCGTHRRWSTVKVRVDFKDNWNVVVVDNDC